MRWIYSQRYLTGQIPRATHRTTLVYRFTETFQGGVEYNARVNAFNPIANWRILSEKDKQPALILGTSSDRIGTPSGQSVYLTLSKNLLQGQPLVAAPYIGWAYSGFENRLLFLGGLNLRPHPKNSLTLLHDGVNSHLLISHDFNEQESLGLVLVKGKHPGMTFSLAW